MIAWRRPIALRSGSVPVLATPRVLALCEEASVAAIADHLDDPQSPVTFRVAMRGLPDGTSYPGSVVLGIPASQIEVRITNSNYQKLAQ